jgi:curli biogenesis system outer membrane secretion channel CsgG
LLQIEGNPGDACGLEGRRLEHSKEERWMNSANVNRHPNQQDGNKRPDLLLGIALFTVVGLLALPVAAQPAKGKVTVAVMDFKVARKIEPGLQTTLKTSVLTEKLKTALAETHKFEILERQDVDMLTDEIRFAQSSAGDRSHGPKKGKMVGADYMVTGEISLIQFQTGSRPIPSTSRYNQITSGTIIADIRIIDTQRASVATAAKVEASASRSVITTSPSAGSVDDLFIEDLQRTLVEKMANKVIETVYPIKVASISSDGTLYLNRGQGSGLNVGDRLEVYQPGAPIVDPDTHEVLGGQDVLVGVAKVTEVQPRLSLAKILQSTKSIGVGAILKHPQENLGGGGSGEAQAPHPTLNW